jgi:hypothetical protein
MPANVNGILAKLGEATRNGDAEAVAALAAELQTAMRSSAPDEPQQFVEKLEKAVNAYDRKLVSELCETLVATLWKRKERYPFDPAKAILDVLRRKRHFDEMAKVAEVFIQTGQDTPRIRRQCAQALLDRKQIAAALCVLESLKNDREKDKEKNENELKEAIGLIGRAHKQIYMDSAASEGAQTLRKGSLEPAVASCAQPFKNDASNIWHGINAVALEPQGCRSGTRQDSQYSAQRGPREGRGSREPA